MSNASPDIEFFWDPVCPFAWVTSRWVHQVIAQKDYSVDWRFISLRLLNKDKDYATEFPPEYPRMHGAGLRMLRVAAKARAEQGRELMGPLYTAMGSSIWDADAPKPGEQYLPWMGTAEHIESILSELELPTEWAAAADDESYDVELQAETDAALEHTGRDVGTPIIAFQPPDGPAFFGPVISRIPSDEDAVALWDSVIHLATFPGFAEMKRSLREMPQLRVLGVADAQTGPEQDWQGGSRRQD